MKKEFFKKAIDLTGDETVVARAGEGIDNPWDGEDQSPGLYGIQKLTKEGKLTPKYKKLLKELHMVDAKPAGENIQPSEEIEKHNKEWRKIQEKKEAERVKSTERIETYWVEAENRKIKHLEELKNTQVKEV